MTEKSGRAPVIVSVEDGELVVTPTGFDQLWALRRRLRAPMEAVAHVAVEDPRTVPAGLRLPGTSVPGVIRAGSYGWGANRSFWVVHRAARVLVIELRGQPYRRLVLEVADPDAVAATITAARRDAG